VRLLPEAGDCVREVMVEGRPGHFSAG